MCPDETTALTCVYMATMPLDPTGEGKTRWTMRWTTALNAFDITFDGRLSAARRQPRRSSCTARSTHRCRGPAGSADPRRLLGGAGAIAHTHGQGSVAPMAAETVSACTVRGTRE